MSTQQQYGLGRLYMPDHRDCEYLLKELTPAKVRIKTRHYRTHAALNQLETPYCVGFAWAQWLYSAPLMSKLASVAAPSAIYAEAQKHDEWDGEGYAGTSVRGGAKALQSLGHIKHYFWEYTTEGVRDWLCADRGTIVLGTNWYANMTELAPGAYAKPNGGAQGGHAYLCCGYNQRSGSFRCINSWGSSWGDNGRFWLAGEDLELLLSQDGEACAATQQELIERRVN